MLSTPAKRNQPFSSPVGQSKLISPLLQIPLGPPPPYGTLSITPSQSHLQSSIIDSATTNLQDNSTPPLLNNQSLIKISKQVCLSNTDASKNYSSNSIENYQVNTHQSSNNQYPSIVQYNQPIENIAAHSNTSIKSFTSNLNSKTNNNNNDKIKLEEISYHSKMKEKEKNFAYRKLD